MAKTNSGSRMKNAGAGRRIALGLIAFVVLLGGISVATLREPIAGYAAVGTSYAARVGCSCRFVAGRSLEDCAKDKLAGMELVTLAEDVETKSVTARFPLVTATTARLREGYGCVLEKWEG